MLDKLVGGDIPVEPKEMAPFDVWNECCDDDIFEGMECDGTFVRRLCNLRMAVKEGKKRADGDAALFDIAKANHPVPKFNHRGEPQWNGSDAQTLLKQDMDDGKHHDMKPKDLWESRPEHMMFQLATFRDHIHQETKSRKCLHTLKFRAEEKRKGKLQEMKERRRKEDKQAKNRS